MNDFRVRPAVPGDAGFLVDMWTEAVNWLPGRALSRERILAEPSFAHYVTGWMRPDDVGVVATDGGDTPIGAA